MPLNDDYFVYEDFGEGYVPSKKDIRDYRINKKVCSAVNLPNYFEVPHSKIKNQGAVCSCVAHSVSEVLEALERNEIDYSTAWIYGYRPIGYYQGAGMMTRDAMRTVAQVGAIQHDILPQNIELPEAKTLVHSNLSTYKKLASTDKIASYASLHSVQEIKEVIYKTKQPVVICIVCGNPFRLDKNFIIQIPESFEINGGHAMVCYGWNELGLLIQNSWGEGFGDKGCCILPYEYPFSEAWVMTKDPDITVKPGAFALREFIVNICKIVVKIIKGLFNKK